MIGRRAIITAALGALGAGASGVKPSDVVKASMGLPSPEPAQYSPDHPYPIGQSDDFYRVSSKYRNVLHDERNLLIAQIQRGLPADLASKRSWSATYKDGVARKRLLAIGQAINSLEHPDTARFVLSKLGIKI